MSRFSGQTSLFVALLLAIASTSATHAGESRPNVIVILADDLGWRDTTVYGSQFYETPNIARLAERGMTFTNAYSASPLCSPTRASVLTGLWPARLRFTTPAGHLPKVVLDPKVPDQARPDRKAVTPQTRTRLPNKYVTYAEVLKNADYATAFMGKWHLGRAPYLPEHQGFEEVVGGRGHPGPPGGYFAPFPKIDTIPNAKLGEHIDDILGREAVAFIKDHRDGPFLLNFWPYSVHAPFQAKLDLIEKYGAKADSDEPQNCPTMGAMIETMDKNIGKVLDALDRLGIADETIIIFTSDNGGNMYSEVDGVVPTSNAPLRNGKGSIYEGGQRVPLIVVWPGVVEPGSDSDTVVTSVDYFPTLLEMLELQVTEEVAFDGVSLVPLLNGSGTLDREAIFCHFPHYVPATGNLPSTSVRRGDWKLIRFYADGEDQTDRFELYNLTDDPGERNDLSAEKPELVAELDRLIDDFNRETDALLPAANPNYRPATTDQVENGAGS